jgi:hypothetical protein
VPDWSEFCGEHDETNRDFSSDSLSVLVERTVFFVFYHLLDGFIKQSKPSFLKFSSFIAVATTLYMPR